MQQLTLGMEGTRSFSYVRIPGDDAEPLEECTGVIYDDMRGAGDQMKKLLVPKFTVGHVDEDALKKTTLQQVSQQDGDPNLLSQLTPDIVARQGASVESFRLSDTVNMYLDEVGALKRLSPNKRASNLAARCGYGEGVPFCGDLYVGRLCHSLGPEPLNVDFKMEDMFPQAGWIKSAAIENLAHQVTNCGVPSVRERRVVLRLCQGFINVILGRVGAEPPGDELETQPPFEVHSGLPGRRKMGEDGEGCLQRSSLLKEAKVMVTSGARMRLT